MDNLSPAARDTLLALRDGPGNVHEVAGRTGRSRSGTDKALRELAKHNLIVKVDGGDPADGAPARWQHTTEGDHTAETIATAAATDEQAGGGDEQTAVPAEADTEAAPSPPGDTTDPVDTDARTGDVAAPEQTDAEQAAVESAPGEASQEAAPDGGEDGEVEEVEPAKLCRGCGAQMPKICPQCWQKTPGYCGTCRQQMPQARRGEPGEPTILASGLPRLRPGELEKLVLAVITEQPMPHHVGITGWTAQRVAIYLPGRSTGAIGNALTKLANTGQLELIGENPMRFQLTGAGDTTLAPDDNDTTTTADAAAAEGDGGS